MDITGEVGNIKTEAEFHQYLSKKGRTEVDLEDGHMQWAVLYSKNLKFSDKNESMVAFMVNHGTGDAHRHLIFLSSLVDDIDIYKDFHPVKKQGTWYQCLCGSC